MVVYKPPPAVVVVVAAAAVAAAVVAAAAGGCSLQLAACRLVLVGWCLQVGTKYVRIICVLQSTKVLR